MRNNKNCAFSDCIGHQFDLSGRGLYKLGAEDGAYIVLQEDGTEVDEEEYFDMLPDKTHLVILTEHQLWSPSLSMQG